jgi:SAM-dependent methyltransferase
MILKCPACNNVNIIFLGKLPSAYHFCDVVFDNPLNEASLYSCRECGLWFRFPCLPDSEIIKFYETASAQLWRCDTQQVRPEWILVKEYVRKYSIKPGTILDVGCYQGEFLDFLGNEWGKYGVEPSLAASAVARQRGKKKINHVAGNLSNIEKP